MRLRSWRTPRPRLLRPWDNFVVPFVLPLSGTPLKTIWVSWNYFPNRHARTAKQERIYEITSRVLLSLSSLCYEAQELEEVLTEFAVTWLKHCAIEPEDQQCHLLSLVTTDEGPSSSRSDQEFQRSRAVLVWCACAKICTPPALCEDYQAPVVNWIVFETRCCGRRWHRVLIFSQFKGMLEKIEQELPDLGRLLCKLRGQPQPRKDKHTKALTKRKRCLSDFLRQVVFIWTWQVLIQWSWLDLVESCGSVSYWSKLHRMGQERLRSIAWWPREPLKKNSGTSGTEENIASQVLDGTESRGSSTLAEEPNLEASTLKSRIRHNEVLKGNRNERRTISIGRADDEAHA